MLLLKDGGGIKEQPIMLIGEEEGRIEVATVMEDGRLKIFSQLQLPEFNGAIRVTKLMRLDKNHVLCVYYRRVLYIIHLPSLTFPSFFELPQPIPEGSQWPEEIYIKDACILTPSKNERNQVELVLAVEKWGLLNVLIHSKSDGKHWFKVT